MSNIINVPILKTSDKNFSKKFNTRLRINTNVNLKVEKDVLKLINNVRTNGNSSLLNLVKKYDNVNISKISDLQISDTEIKKAYSYVTKSQVSNLKKAISRIKKFSKKQLSSSWRYKERGSI